MTKAKPYPFYPGYNARLFPANWRPFREELAFAQSAGFSALQVRRDDSSIDEKHLGDSFLDLSRMMRKARVLVTVELVMHVDEKGRTPGGITPTELFESNLPAVQALNVSLVHWHLVAKAGLSPQALTALENALIPQFAAGVATAEKYGIHLGLEHNEPDVPLFSTPQSIQAALERVPGLMFVWDINHTHPDHLSGFLSLARRMRVLHLSDTPLPAVNHHLPLGQGNIDFETCLRPLIKAGFNGPAILEIGGLPKSGGLGRDTDEALRDSLKYFKKVVEHCLVPDPPE
jgi:L-ribulose-5-phosphate 3-epimerase